MAAPQGTQHVVPPASGYGAHDTDDIDCWCVPQYCVPCNECEDRPAEERGCWKCDAGKVWISYTDACLATRPIIVVHNQVIE